MPEQDIERLLAEVAGEAEVEHARGTHKVRHRNKIPLKEPTQVYSVRLPLGALGKLRELANQRGQAPTTMMREWILERLRAEAVAEADKAGANPDERIADVIPLDLARSGNARHSVDARDISLGIIQMSNSRHFIGRTAAL